MCLYMRDLFVQEVKIGKLIFDAPNPCLTIA